MYEQWKGKTARGRNTAVDFFRPFVRSARIVCGKRVLDQTLYYTGENWIHLQKRTVRETWAIATAAANAGVLNVLFRIS